MRASVRPDSVRQTINREQRRLRDHVCVLAMAVVLMLSVHAAAPAGPPFKTDDPEPVGFRHWEFYLASVQSLQRNNVAGTLPHIEVNYGVAPNVQLHLIAPFAYSRVGDVHHYGYADTELGVKYRFVDETASAPQVGIFPMLEIPTGARDLSSGSLQAELPVWLQKSWGSLTTYGGAGYWINPGAGKRNWVFTGWEVQYTFSDMVTLGAELFYQTPDAVDAVADGGFDLGGYLNLSENSHVLFSVGRNAREPSVISGYLGFQLTL